MKNVVISGASRGIGYEVTRHLASQGHRVLVFTRTIQPVLELAEQFPGKVFVEKVDLTEGSGELATLVSSRFSTVDALINNAGGLINKPFLETDEADWEYMIRVNLMSAILMIKACVPVMGRNSHIVNISSMGGFQGSIKFPGLAAYSTTKGALSILTECISEEMIGQGVHVNCLCIGAVQTEMLATAFPGYKAPVTAPEMAKYVADFALEQGRLFNGKIIPVAINNPKL